MLLIGWRPTLMVVGLIGIPLVAAIQWQSRILQDPSSQAQRVHHQKISGGKLLLTAPMLLFFAFFMISSMASAGMAAWLITVLHTANGMHLEMASWGLTAYMAGVTGGVLVGGWVADRTKRLLTFATTITIVSSAILLVVAALHLPDVAIIALLAGSGIGFGASRTPRDMMLKDAAPPGEMGKVFGFVSSGMPLGQALTPVPFGFLIDRGHPELVLVLVAALLLLSLLCAGSARSTRSVAVAVAAE
jgi:predicted MFS family arabinose efflux permease